jgi:chemotaxis protein MotB
MRATKSTILAMSLLAFAGHAGAVDLTGICCDGGYEYRHPSAFEKEQQRLIDELAAAQKQNSLLTSQLAERNREMAALRSHSDEASSRLAGQVASTQGQLEQSKAHTVELERQLTALQASLREKDRMNSELGTSLQAATGEKDRLAAELAAAQSQVTALQGVTGDKERLAAELAAAQSRMTALHAAAEEKDRLASEAAAANRQFAALEAELAAGKQRNADLEAQLAAMGGMAGEKDTLAAELSAGKQRVAELESQLGERDKELAGLRGELSAEMAKLKEAQRGLVRGLAPQIEKGDIRVDLNNERLLINLASGYLFGSGEDVLKSPGADALRQVGAILKHYPEYKIAVDGHTDNRPIRAGLKKKFPTNKALSEARAANAAKALVEGGISSASTAGYADTRPVEANTTDAGRSKNRRVEVRVTK